MRVTFTRGSTTRSMGEGNLWSRVVKLLYNYVWIYDLMCINLVTMVHCLFHYQLGLQVPAHVSDETMCVRINAGGGCPVQTWLQSTGFTEYELQVLDHTVYSDDCETPWLASYGYTILHTALSLLASSSSKRDTMASYGYTLHTALSLLASYIARPVKTCQNWNGYRNHQ